MRYMDGYSVGMFSRLLKYGSETLEPETVIHVKNSVTWVSSCKLDLKFTLSF